MDEIIQSVTQSPIVKALENVENSTKRFTNDIPDNAPYRTLHKRILDPSSGDRSDPNSTLRFKILRHGHMNRMYLKASLFFPFTPLDSGAVSTFTQSSKALDSSFFASFFTSASLYVGGKCVETMYPENILSKVSQSNVGVRDSLLYWLKGKMSDYSEEEVGNGAFDMGVDDGGVRLEKYANFLIPLDFSIFQFSKDALDTTMLQQCYVEVRKRAVKGFQTEVSGATTKCQLVCNYFQVEHYFRNEIRNANFTKETTTLITMENISLQNCVRTIVPELNITLETVNTLLYESASNEQWYHTLEEQALIRNLAPGITIPASEIDFLTFPDQPGIILDGEYDVLGIAGIADELLRIDLDMRERTFLRRISKIAGSTRDRFFGLYDPATVLPPGQQFTFVQGDFTNPITGTWTATAVGGGNFNLEPPFVDNQVTDAPYSTFPRIQYWKRSVVKDDLNSYPEFARCSFDLNTMHGFITEILITFRKKIVSDPDKFYGDVVAAPSKDAFLKFILKSDDTVLFSKSHHEMMIDTLNTSDQHIGDVSSLADCARIFGAEDNGTRYRNTASIPLDLHDNTTLSNRASPTMYRIPLTMFPGEEFQNGGINLNTMTNVKLIIEGPDLLDELTPTDTRGLEPHIVLRRRILSRVDGQTGCISSHF